MQSPLFWHGADRHSSMSSSQCSPSQPGGQRQLYSSVPAVQLPRTQGPDRHSSMSVSHRAPEKPATHVQVYEAIPSTQVASLLQGLPTLHSSTSVSHRSPVNPSAQMHAPLASHSPPLRHAHDSQFSPAQPGPAQAHAYDATPSVQLPPCRHGDTAHSSSQCRCDSRRLLSKPSPAAPLWPAWLG